MNYSRLFRRYRLVLLTLLIIGIAVAAQAAPATWASPLAQPDRQTVITPTATPVPPTPTLPPTAPQEPIIIVPPEDPVEPGEPEEVVIIITNPGDDPMENTTVTITVPPCVDLSVIGVEQGDITGGPINWEWLIGTVAPGQQIRLRLEAILCDEMLPDECYAVEAILTWDGGGPIEQIAYLCGPSAILPETGE